MVINIGLRGPAPKPTVIEIAEGCPGKRKPSAREPKPPQMNCGAVPEGLGDGEQRWWNYYAGMLASMRVLTEADRTALTTLATASAEREANDEQLRKAGTLYQDRHGIMRVSPLFKVATFLRNRELQLLREFGLTPSARTRVQTVGESAHRDVLDDAIFGT